MVDLSIEHEVGDPVMGIDEAGRGPLVGGVFAAAVHVPLKLAEKLLVGEWKEINDSKKLSEKKREKLAAIIKATPGCVWAVAQATAAEIDELNILRATHLAMKRAADEVADSARQQVFGESLPSPQLNLLPSFVAGVPGVPQKPLSAPRPLEQAQQAIHIIVDGLPVKTLENSRSVIKGDAKSLLIAAASILAKTTRDADCLRLEKLYPGYGIAKHKGYPTKAHYDAIKELGPCREHRKSFRLYR